MANRPEDDGEEQVPDRKAGTAEQDSNPVSPGAPLPRGIGDIQEQLRRSGALGIGEALRGSLVAFRAQDEWRRSLFTIQDQLRQSGAFGIGEALRDSLAAFRVQDRWRGLLDVQEQFRASGAFAIHEALRDSMAAFRAHDEWRRGLSTIQDQLRQSGAFGIGEALRDSLATFRVQDQWWQDRFSVQEQLRASGALGAHQALSESLAAFRAQDQWRQGILGLQEQLHKWNLPGLQQALQGTSLANLITPVSDIQRILAGLRTWADLADAEGFGDEVLSVGPDGSIALGGETATAAEIERALRDLFERFSSFLTDIHSAVLNLRRPVREFVLWFMSTVIIPFLMSYYFQQQASLELREMQQQFQRDIGRTRREVLAAIKAIVPVCPDVGRAQYRVVVGDGVRIRGRPNRGAPVKGLLPLGTVVRFIEKHGPWTAVEYLDQDGAGTLRGWVFNKYLERLERRTRRNG
jgi:hypothetical protein